MGYVLVILLAFIIGILFMVIESAIERRTIELCHYHVKSDKLKKETKLTFIVVADLHSKDYGDNNSALVHAIKGENPDGILIPGDLIIGNKAEDYKVAINLLKDLVNIAPVYYSHGNHEDRMKYYAYDQTTGEYVTVESLPKGDGKSLHNGHVTKYDHYRTLIDGTGAIVLDNGTTTLDIKGEKVDITGLSISLKYFQKFNHQLMEQEEVDVCLASGEKGNQGSSNLHDKNKHSLGEQPFRILMAHNPAHMDAYTKWGADLTVSGHLHGGIIRIPFLGGIITPQVKLLPKYSAGLYKVNGKMAVVSRGLGEHTVNIRVCNPPELSVIHITR